VRDEQRPKMLTTVITLVLPALNTQLLHLDLISMIGFVCLQAITARTN